MGLFKDENGKLSSTRITLVVMLCLIVYVIVFRPDLVNDLVINSISPVIYLCLSGTTVRGSLKQVRNVGGNEDIRVNR